MNWINISTPFAVVASLLVFLQGVSILRAAGKAKEAGNKKKQIANERKELKHKENILKTIGRLTILMATLGTIINILFVSTDIAISPEFGVFIIQGIIPTVFFALCVLGLILCISLGWELARLREHWKLWGRWLYGLGFVIWLASCSILLTRINAPAGNEDPVFLYDIWWPPLLLWMTIGFTDIALTILRVRDGVVRGLVAMSMVIVVLLVALDQGPQPDFAHPWTRGFWAAAAILLLISMVYEVSKPFRMIKADGKEPGHYAILSHLKQNSAQEFFKIDKQQWYTLASLACIVVGVGILLSSPSYVGPAPGIIVILVGWGAMTEIVTDGWFHDLYQDYRSGQWLAENGTIDKASMAVRNGIRSSGERLGKIFSLPAHWTALIKLFLLVVVLILLNETLNRGKTIIQPFQVIGFQDPTALVDSADDRLINYLSVLNQQLQPIIIFPTSAGIKKKRIDYVQAGNVSSSIDAALTGSGEFDLGTIKIPANVLIAPLQGVIRPWLKTRVVSGSIISNGNEYVLLVNASDGSTWISRPVDRAVDGAVDGPVDGPVGGAVDTEKLYKVIPGLVDEIAFLMLSSEDTLQNYGLTKDWDAFQSFRKGVEHIQSYEREQDYDALADAIEDFKVATRKDPGFALAFYRLGLALQQNRQPWQAEGALRMGLSLNPGSVPLKNALAYHLYFFDSYTPLYPAVFPTPNPSSYEVKKYQARLLWHQIVNLPGPQVSPADRASAYLGLCNSAMNDDNENSDYLAYFYCFKSHTLLERLPQDQQSQDKIRQADASALNNLGVIIYGRGSSTTKRIEGWYCQGRELNKAGNDLVSPNLSYHPAYVSAALQYYEKALSLQPQDNVIRCNAATAALLQDQDKRMWELEQIAQAHYVVGSQYIDQARKESSDAASPSPYYKEALKEYRKAIELNPTFHEALNAYAYTYWVFRLRWPEESLETLGKDPFNSLAAYYADKALRLAKMQQDDYLEVIYGSTKAEALIANGDFQRARNILLELKPKVPKSYVLDEVRWDLAQASLCLSEMGEEEVSKMEMENEAKTYLEEIQQHEEMLETYVFSYTGNKFLTDYRLPCRQFISIQK